MEEQTIRMIAGKKGVKEVDLFVKFIQTRFPNESDSIHSYVSEWCDRFNTGSPTNYMDNESLRIYKELL